MTNTNKSNLMLFYQVYKTSNITEYHTFQPPSSSEREVFHKLSISLRWQHGCQNFGFQALWKPEKCTLQDLLLSQILHCLRETFREYSPDITTQTSPIVYLIPQHFSSFKNYKVLIPKLVSGGSFASAKAIRAFVDKDLLFMMNLVAKSNACT